VSALPAENYSESPSPDFPFRPEAEVVNLADRRSETRLPPPPPEYKQDKPARTDRPSSSPDSGTRITLGDIPGDWDSVTEVWEGQPTSLKTQVGRAMEALHSDDPKQIALGCWWLLVTIPRGLLHLGSWTLDNPLRTLAALLLLGVLIGSLTL
jgi:hypothetical protein